MAGNTLQVYKTIKKKIEHEFKSASYTVKSAGFKQDKLTEPVSHETGYWEDYQRVTSKPPRWIIQFDMKDGVVRADFAKRQDGSYFQSSNTIGYINNREGNCAAILFRIIASIKNSDGKFVFPEWEWVLALVFQRPLPVGNSSETISNINPNLSTIDYQRNPFNYSLLGIVTTNVENPTFIFEGIEQTITYEQVSEALKNLLEPSN